MLVDQALQHARQALVVPRRLHRRHGAQHVKRMVVRVVDAPVRYHYSHYEVGERHDMRGRQKLLSVG